MLGQGAAELAVRGVGSLRARCSSPLRRADVDTTCIVETGAAELARGAAEVGGAATLTADAMLGFSAFEEGSGLAELIGTGFDFSK